MECQHCEVTSRASTQVDDVRNVVDGIMEDLGSTSKEFAYLRKTCACERWALAGHSMGSAITFNAAADLKENGYNVIGQISVSPPFSAGGGLFGGIAGKATLGERACDRSASGVATFATCQQALSGRTVSQPLCTLGADATPAAALDRLPRRPLEGALG